MNTAPVWPAVKRCWIPVYISLGSGYLFWCVYMPSLRGGDTFRMTAPILILGFIVCCIAAYVSGCSRNILGLRLDRWRKDIGVALASSVILLILAILFKSIWISGSDKPVLALSDHLSGKHLWIIPAYLLFVPMQNFIFRSCLQGFLYSHATGRWQQVLAVISASLVYSAFHVHISLALAVATVLPGLVWGAVYAHSRSVLAITLSHILTGLVAFYVIGFHDLCSA